MVPTIHSRTIRYVSKMSIDRFIKGKRQSVSAWIPTLWQILRFSLVGIVNTGIDLLAFNLLLWLVPTQSTSTLLFYNSLAYALGAFNSFLWNKYWTFQNKERTTTRELLTFIGTVLLGIACNDLILGMTSTLFRSFIGNSLLLSNGCKILAIFGTLSISYLGMRLWVFVRPTRKINADNDNESLVA
jgi:putative flippase GtrA